MYQAPANRGRRQMGHLFFTPPAAVIYGIQFRSHYCVILFSSMSMYCGFAGVVIAESMHNRMPVRRAGAVGFSWRRDMVLLHSEIIFSMRILSGSPGGFKIPISPPSLPRLPRTYGRTPSGGPGGGPRLYAADLFVPPVPCRRRSPNSCSSSGYSMPGDFPHAAGSGT